MSEQTTPAVAPPIDATDSELKVLVRNFLMQALLVGSAVVALLGLPEKSFLARSILFLKSEEAVPLLAALSSLGASGWMLWRARKKHRALQVTTLLLPDAVAKGPEKPAAAVVAAVEAANVELDRSAVALPSTPGEVR